MAALRVDTSDDDMAALLLAIDALALARLAEAQHVAALVHERLSRLAMGIPSLLLARLKPTRKAAAVRQLHALKTISEIDALLDEPFLAIKGPVLAGAWYHDPTLRSYSDIDILVSPHDFATALEKLVDAGFELLSNNWNRLLKLEVAEIPLSHKGSVVDFHWHPIAMGSARSFIRLDVDALMDRAQRVTLQGVSISTFDAEDTLLHLCIHTGLDGARQLKQLVDIDVVVRSDRVDWEIFVTRAREAGAHGLCAAVLQRACNILGTPLPQGLLDDLTPFRGWLTINALINRRRRVGHRLAFNGIASGILLASGRATLATTVTTGVRASIEAVQLRAGKLGLTEPGGKPDWQRRPKLGQEASDQHRYAQWVLGE